MENKIVGVNPHRHLWIDEDIVTN